MNTKQFSHMGAAVIVLVTLIAALTQATSWSCADASPHRLWRDVTHTLRLSKLTLRLQRDEAVQLEPGNDPDARIRWAD